MKLKTKGLSYILFSLCCIAMSNSSIASVHKHKDYKGELPIPEATQISQNHFEIIGAGGGAKLKAGNSAVGVTSSETDTLVQTNENSWNTLAGQLGVGYFYFFGDAQQNSGNFQWFPSIEPQLNLYHLTSNSIKGDVWRFGSPAYNQFTFDIPLDSTRFMLDLALTVASWDWFSIYAKGGVGYARNRISYSDNFKANSGDCIIPNLKLNSRTNSNFAWEAGAGVIFAINEKFGVSLEYLYTDLGKVRTAASGNIGTSSTSIVSAPSFNLKSQTALLGLHIAV